MEEADVELRGFYDEARLGNGVQATGDQDGDGYEDYVLSFGSGVVASLMPGGLNRTLHVEDEALSAWYLEGEAEWVFVKMIGDVDGDGKLDAAMVIENYDTYIHTGLALSPTRTEATARARVEMDGYCAMCLRPGRSGRPRR
jgi:hypothetical protein